MGSLAAFVCHSFGSLSIILMTPASNLSFFQDSVSSVMIRTSINNFPKKSVSFRPMLHFMDRQGAISRHEGHGASGLAPN